MRPGSGLTGFDDSPSRAVAQWLDESPTPVYRCGGSRGFDRVPVSPWRSNDAGHLMRVISIEDRVKKQQLCVEPQQDIGKSVLYSA
jgi:hypothetical protein